jgi:hypothetical protein
MAVSMGTEAYTKKAGMVNVNGQFTIQTSFLLQIIKALSIISRIDPSSNNYFNKGARIFSIPNKIKRQYDLFHKIVLKPEKMKIL